MSVSYNALIHIVTIIFSMFRYPRPPWPPARHPPPSIPPKTGFRPTSTCVVNEVSPPRSLFQPASGGKLFSAMPVMPGLFVRR